VIGLRTVYNIEGDDESRANAEYIKENYLDKGKLGVASGEGFYTYRA
jgi:3-hydroxyacyl-CoA dehydrogenase